MGRVIVGTAGHIDHGKTRLVEALTGIDCDRWQEEKTRGITIDLGFAHLEEGERQLGFVDVPGHERFLHNALAGLGGIRIVLLVVAADEGVKPQTREHLDICSLLEIPAALVALTKTDLVTPDLLELATLEIEELLAPTRFAGAPVLPVSATTGEGVPELRRRLLELAAEQETPLDPERPARLPVDRAFHLKGLGTVITGTLVSGRIATGDSLELLPQGLGVRVRSIQVHGQGREEALAGERTALQLTGATLAELERGRQLAAPGSLVPGVSLAARFTLLPDAPKAIRGSTPIRFHLYASEVVGRLRPLGGKPLEPGETGPVEIRLSRPVAAVRGDRFVVRRPSPQTTLGGGRILDPAWRRRRGKELAAALAALEGDRPSALLLWIEEGGEAGVETPPLAPRLGTTAAAVERDLESLRDAQKVLETAAGQGHGRRWLLPAAYRRVAERAARVLAGYFERDRLAAGIPKAEALRRILPGRAAELADVYFGWLAAQQAIAVEGDLVSLPGRTASLTGEESRLSAQVVAAYEEAGLRPPSPAALRERLGAKPQILDGVIRYLVDRGDLARLPGDLLISAAVVRRLAADLAGSLPERFSVPQFKERYDLTRKWAIPILEHLDSIGATRRLGDERQVVKRPA